MKPKQPKMLQTLLFKTAVNYNYITVPITSQNLTGSRNGVYICVCVYAHTYNYVYMHIYIYSYVLLLNITAGEH